MIQRPSDLKCYSNLVITDPSGSGAFRSGRRVRPAALLNHLTSPSLISDLQFTGVILLAVGVWGKVSLESYFSLASEESTNAPYVLIGTGAAIIIFGLFGCFATCRGSPWMLKLYAMFLTLMFLAELVAGISGFIFRHEIKAKLKVAFKNDLMSYNSSDSSRSVVDTIQQSVSGRFSASLMVLLLSVSP
eukprot:XP_011616622.1 PREDICTED: tetraspanin-7-like [Takifugu rubripes]